MGTNYYIPKHLTSKLLNEICKMNPIRRWLWFALTRFAFERQYVADRGVPKFLVLFDDGRTDWTGWEYYCVRGLSVLHRFLLRLDRARWCGRK